MFGPTLMNLLQNLASLSVKALIYCLASRHTHSSLIIIWLSKKQINILLVFELLILAFLSLGQAEERHYIFGRLISMSYSNKQLSSSIRHRFQLIPKSRIRPSLSFVLQKVFQNHFWADFSHPKLWPIKIWWIDSNSTALWLFWPSIDDLNVHFHRFLKLKAFRCVVYFLSTIFLLKLLKNLGSWQNTVEVSLIFRTH